MSWLLPGFQHLLKACDGHIAWVDACCHGSIYAKSWAFASNSPHISQVAALCPHTFRHESIVGKKTPLRPSTRHPSRTPFWRPGAIS